MKRILLVVLSIVFVSEVMAQQDPQFTQNMFNKLPVNPAFAGSKGSICGTLLSREQWMGFEGNPKTNLFSADGAFKIRQQYQMGGGLTIIQDQIGPLRSLNAKAAISYHHKLSQGVLAVGLDFGIFNQSIKGDWKTSSFPRDGSEDPNIPNSEAGSTTFDMGGGLYYYTRDLYVGISSTHLTQPDISDKPDETSTYGFKQARHYYLMAGYNYPVALGGGQLELQPSIFAKSDGVSSQLDLNFNALYNNLVWAGVTYRMEDAVALLVGLKLETVAMIPADLQPLSIGFAYDYNISDLSDYNDGSIEFMLNYCYKINREIKIERYKSVRFL